MDEAAKEQLMARFRAYLDATDDLGALDSERDAYEYDDDDAQAAPDLFSLLTEIITLKNEVKLESRLVKTALDEFRDLFDSLRDANTSLAEQQQQRLQQEQAAVQRKQEKLILELLDLRDRMQAGQEQCQRFRPGWFSRRRSTEFVTSMSEGMAMNLRRLDELLSRRGVRPFSVLQQNFDPHRMHADEVTNDPELAVGVVVAELRKGFLFNGELLRLAEVVVNRPDQAAPETETLISSNK